MIKVLPSTNPCNEDDLVDYVRSISDLGIEYIHCDVMDGNFVENKCLTFELVEKIKNNVNILLDIHLMVNEPSKYIPLYAELNAEYITFQIEIDENIEKDLKMIKDYSIKCGLAIKPDTKVSSLIPYLPYLDLILVMSVEPGMGGQSFIAESENKIKEVRTLLNSYNLDTIISVDGGINDKTVAMCRDADMVAAGSYIVLSDNFQEKISSLR